MKLSILFTLLPLVATNVLASVVPTALNAPAGRPTTSLSQASQDLTDGDASAFAATYVPVNVNATDITIPMPDGSRDAGDLIQFVAALINWIIDGVKKDNEGRSQFTQKTVAEGSAKWPEYNWIICHTSHSYDFHGTKGVDWGHYHVEFDLQIGGTVGYEVYWIKSGVFRRHGDGGFLNWAWLGWTNSVTDGGATIDFRRP